VPPSIRTDIVDVYIFRRWPDETIARSDPVLELLQLFRARPPLAESWQPVMGKVIGDETAPEAARREVFEEVGLSPDDLAAVGFWALEQVSPFYMRELDAVVMSPRFALEVTGTWRPTLNGEHTDFRWISAHQASRYFMWPGQLAAVREIREAVVRPGSIAEAAMRVEREREMADSE
jgi:dihydroneopterin triphosphate diphosphatase